jgi:uncharacterized protein YbjT (DUF2867 family)
VRLAQALIQPIAADDVAQALAAVVGEAPRQGVVEIAGPERFRLDEVIRERLRYAGDSREVLADPLARYFGAQLDEDELLPADGARLASTRLRDWLAAAEPVPAPA